MRGVCVIKLSKLTLWKNGVDVLAACVHMCTSAEACAWCSSSTEQRHSPCSIRVESGRQLLSCLQRLAYFPETQTNLAKCTSNNTIEIEFEALTGQSGSSCLRLSPIPGVRSRREGRRSYFGHHKSHSGATVQANKSWERGESCQKSPPKLGENH